ncbi:MAG: DnaJ domain-containing protein [Pseudomonadota bacterium]
MSIFIGLLGAVLALGLIFMSVSAEKLAAFLRSAGPALLIASGGGLVLLKQPGLGSMLVLAGLAAWRRSRGVQQIKSGAGPQKSSVRSAALEMELDHDTGDMNGIVLVGQFEGMVLDEMDEEALHRLHEEIVYDGDSVALLDSYLDRRFPGWREDAKANAGAGQGSATGSGPMGEEEAYEVLGLVAGASEADIRKAHRRLMKTAHPDSGGSTFLAAKINEAKDVLLRSHS